MIEQNITPVDTVPLRSEAADETAYRQSVEAFLVALKKLSEEFDVAIPQFNSTAMTINGKEASAVGAALTATDEAAIATTKAEEALESATRAESLAEEIKNKVIPIEATYNYTTQDWRCSMMSKAQFNALASERRANRAGSGFDEFGKERTGMAGYSFVNSGISTISTVSNTFVMGWNDANKAGVSSSDYPKVSINGVNNILNCINTNGANYSAKIELPQAPTIYPYNLVMPYGTTLTQAQIDAGWVSSVDSSNGGLLPDCGLSGMMTSATVISLSNLTIGKSYAFELSVTLLNALCNLTISITDINDTLITSVNHTGTTISTKKVIIFVATSTAVKIFYQTPIADTYRHFEINKQVGAIATATLTQQQIASGLIKHADASNCGLILNGRFDNNTTGWNAQSGFSISINANRLRTINTASGGLRGSPQAVATMVGKKYVVEVAYEFISGDSADYPAISKADTSTFTGANAVYQYPLSKTAGLNRATLEFTATATTSYIFIGSYSANTTATIVEFDNCAIFPADAISRTDFCFLKKKIANIATNDFFYPFGNTQFLGTTGDCGATVAGAFAGSATYSLFSDIWQEDGALVGKGYVWSALSDANKKLATSNPESNTYLDGNLVYQAQHGLKVEMMKGDNFTEATAFASLGYTQDAVDKGLWKHADGSEAIGIALVHRRNQGAYHPVYNPNGTKLASDGNKWYNTAVSFTSIADCFTDTKLMTASGYIGTTSARPDGLFYDQIHEGDITDLRMNSAKVEDYNRLIDREFNKLVAGTYRGSEGEWVTERSLQTSTNTASLAVFLPSASTKVNIGDTVQLFNEYDSSMKRVIVTTVGTSSFDYSSAYGTFNRQNGSYVIMSIKSTRTKSNTLTHTDIIGSPSNYPTAWKQSGVSGTPLIVAEDGTSLLPTGALTTFKNSRKVTIGSPVIYQVLKSTDNGATWTLLTSGTHYSFTATTNSIAFVTAPATTDLIMVTYQTHTNMVIAGANSEVLANGNALLCNGYYTTHGSLLLNSLTSKVAIGSADTFVFRIPLASIYTTSTIYGVGVYAPTHNSVSLGNITSPSVKTFPYLTRSNGKARLQLVFKEMKHNGTSWGDDNKFNIVDNVSTTTDNNAQAVLIGQKYAELPYFISAGE